LPQPPQRRPAHVRYTAVGPDIRQLTRGSRGSKVAGCVAEGKDQVTHSLAGTNDLSRTEPIGDRDRKQTGAGSESSACGKWSIKLRSARTKTDGRSCSRLNCQCAYADSSKQSQQPGFHCRALHRHPLSAGRSDDLRWVLVSRRSPLPAQISILEDLCQWALLRFEGGGDARRWPTRHGFRVGPAAAQSTTRSFYNERGSFAGSSVTRGNSSSFYDWQGRFSCCRALVERHVRPRDAPRRNRRTAPECSSTRQVLKPVFTRVSAASVPSLAGRGRGRIRVAGIRCRLA
jgi:hypothetical protein